MDFPCVRLVKIMRLLFPLLYKISFDLLGT